MMLGCSKVISASTSTASGLKAGSNDISISFDAIKAIISFGLHAGLVFLSSMLLIISNF